MYRGRLLHQFFGYVRLICQEQAGAAQIGNCTNHCQSSNRASQFHKTIHDFRFHKDILPSAFFYFSNDERCCSHGDPHKIQVDQCRIYIHHAKYESKNGIYDGYNQAFSSVLRNLLIVQLLVFCLNRRPIIDKNQSNQGDG